MFRKVMSFVTMCRLFLAHCCMILELVMGNLMTWEIVLWQFVECIMVPSWNKKYET